MPTDTPNECDHVGTNRVHRTATGFLNDHEDEILCADCGGVACPHPEAALTFHTERVGRTTWVHVNCTACDTEVTEYDASEDGL